MTGVDGLQRLPLLERSERSHQRQEKFNFQPTDSAEEPKLKAQSFCVANSGDGRATRCTPLRLRYFCAHVLHQAGIESLATRRL